MRHRLTRREQTKGGRIGGHARARRLSAKRRREIARAGAIAKHARERERREAERAATFAAVARIEEQARVLSDHVKALAGLRAAEQRLRDGEARRRAEESSQADA